MELAPSNRVAAHNRLYALHLSETIGDDGLFDALQGWGAGQPYGSERPDRDRNPDRRLRIGYVSADFAGIPSAGSWRRCCRTMIRLRLKSSAIPTARLWMN